MKGKQLGGLFEVNSELFFDNKEIFYGGIFPYRIKLKPIKLSDDIHLLTDTIIQNLDIFKNKDHRWKLSLFGRTILSLTKKDFDYLKLRI